MSVMLKWQGATHRFKSIPPELYQRVPGKGKFVRFELTVQVREERTSEGQHIVQQVPALVSIQLDDLVTGSMPGMPGTSVPAGKPVTPGGKV